MRYFSEVAYKGTHFHGWQKQQNAHTVQSAIEETLTKLLGTETTITGSGRTDTGVHALQQFFHFDDKEELDTADLMYKLNAILSADIVIKEIAPVIPTAHARYDATSRSYIYRINRLKNPFLQDQAYFFSRNLQIPRMNEACELLTGEKNFQCFSKVKTQVNNFFCNVLSAKWVVHNDVVEFHITANRFLRGMVRAMVGTLLLIGEEKISQNQLENILQSGDRRKAGRAVPPEGLYLSSVVYPESIYLNE